MTLVRAYHFGKDPVQLFQSIPRPVPASECLSWATENAGRRRLDIAILYRCGSLFRVCWIENGWCLDCVVTDFRLYDALGGSCDDIPEPLDGGRLVEIIEDKGIYHGKAYAWFGTSPARDRARTDRCWLQIERLDLIGPGPA